MSAGMGPDAHHARMGAILAAAQRLANGIEDETTRKGFDLATALQCVLAQAREHHEAMEAIAGRQP